MKSDIHRHQLRNSLRIITIGGSLFWIFNACVAGPIATDFLNRIGFTELEFGLISGLSMIALCLQLVGALLNAYVVTSRKTWFILFQILGRLVLIPIAIVPLVFHGAEPAHLVRFVIILTIISVAAGNLAPPIWWSWLADLIPHSILNRYWGNRERILQFVSISSMLAVALATYGAHRVGLDIIPFYALMTCIGCVAGVVDILLYIRVFEPPHASVVTRSFAATFIEPLRHHGYALFILFSCVMSAAAFFAAAFMLLYTLKELRLPLWQASLIWPCASLGIALTAAFWGRLADRHGQKPLLTLCTSFKPLIALVFVFITPGTAVWVLPIAFALDGTLNAGIAIAHNGYMVKMAPKENRAMFIAFLSSMAGICGGLGAMAGGMFLSRTSSFNLDFMGRTWNHYHLLFLASFFMRFVTIYLAGKLKEPEVSGRDEVISDILRWWPLRALRYPAGLYQRVFGKDEAQPM